MLTSYDLCVMDIEDIASEYYEDTGKMTLKQLKDELELVGKNLFIPGFLPFFQINFGIKGPIYDNLYLLIDAGIWDGFLIRGGIPFRL
ncbi:MAG: hypothetical protein ACETWK_08280 [Candidatus Aminicenantaceae bacterium]